MAKQAAEDLLLLKQPPKPATAHDKNDGTECLIDCVIPMEEENVVCDIEDSVDDWKKKRGRGKIKVAKEIGITNTSITDVQAQGN